MKTGVKGSEPARSAHWPHHRQGQEELYRDVLITRIGSRPPRYRLEQFLESGKKKVALMVKAGKGRKGYDIVTDEKGHGFWGKTRREALEFFRGLQPAEES